MSSLPPNPSSLRLSATAHAGRDGARVLKHSRPSPFMHSVEHQDIQNAITADLSPQLQEKIVHNMTAKHIFDVRVKSDPIQNIEWQTSAALGVWLSETDTAPFTEALYRKAQTFMCPTSTPTIEQVSLKHHHVQALADAMSGTKEPVPDYGNELKEMHQMQQNLNTCAVEIDTNMNPDKDCVSKFEDLQFVEADSDCSFVIV